jgi:ribosomal protein S18 acetylase RimI-like enzyme
MAYFSRTAATTTEPAGNRAAPDVAGGFTVAMANAFRADGFELSGDRSRLNLDLVHHWLSTDSYWAAGRSPELMRAAVDGSVPYGVYRVKDGRQVAFARVVTDGAVFAYLSDVYVDRSCRGIGLGSWLVRLLRDDLAGRGLRRFVLTTNDAQGVYAPLGFEPVNAERWLECDLRTVPVSSATGKDQSH